MATSQAGFLSSPIQSNRSAAKLELRVSVPMDNSRDGRPSMLGLGRASGNARFPLAADFFPAVECSAEQHAFLAQQARQLSSGAATAAKWAMSYEDGTNGWKLANSQKHFRETGVRSYCRRRAGRDRAGQRLLEFRCMGKVALSLDRCLDALYSDRTADFRSTTTFLVDSAVDGAVLLALERRSAQQPHHYLGLNWVAARPRGYFTKSRDFCYLRSMGTTMDGGQNEVGYLVIQSVDLKECASLESSLGLSRAKLSGVLLFKQNPTTHTTNVLWQGSMALSGHSSSKVVTFLHESFASMVANLHKVTEAKYMARQVEGHRLQRLTAGYNMCKDCETSSRATAFASDSEAGTPSSGRADARFCKKCVTTARHNMNNQSESFISSDDNMFPESPRPSTMGKGSNQSSSTSTSSLQKLLAAQTNGGSSGRPSKHTPLFVGAATHMSSAGEVPISPLSIRTQREKRRSRLETDPMESYDGFDNREYGVPLEVDETDDYGPQEPTKDSYSSYPYVPDRRGSQEARDTDMANRLREISQRAQEALDVTKRNSCMMSDTSSAPRVSDLSAFKELDKSIAEQADLLNVIGFVSTGRVYMENNGPEQGGVRASESSSVMSEDERFEVLA
ncbi:hypothetical protein BBJ28_00018518 [Nothophytophthora sp. Chile5]|nr:hypothetical protein BBJ28_00018518 [Nothophytophthora sp. Chile5]